MEKIKEYYEILISTEDFVKQTEIIDWFMDCTLNLLKKNNKELASQFSRELEKICIYLKLLYKAQDMITPMVHYKDGKVIHHNRLTGLREPKFLYGFFFTLSELIIKKYGLEE